MTLARWLERAEDTRARLAALERLRPWLAPALAAVAVAIHFHLNVPDKVVHSPRDQGVRAKKKKKARTPAARTRHPAHEPRSRAELARLWARYQGVPYDEEPRVPAWARTIKPAVRQVVTRARQDTFRGAPEPTSIRAHSFECRTVRCTFLLSSEHPQELELLVATLRRATQGGTHLWHDLLVEPVMTPEGATTPDANTWRVTVALARDQIAPAQVRFPAPGVDQPRRAQRDQVRRPRPQPHAIQNSAHARPPSSWQKYSPARRASRTLLRAPRLSPLDCRRHDDLNQIIRCGQLGLAGPACRAMALRHPSVPNRIHRLKSVHIG